MTFSVASVRDGNRRRPAELAITTVSPARHVTPTGAEEVADTQELVAVDSAAAAALLLQLVAVAAVTPVEAPAPVRQVEEEGDRTAPGLY